MQKKKRKILEIIKYRLLQDRKKLSWYWFYEDTFSTKMINVKDSKFTHIVDGFPYFLFFILIH